MFGWLMARNTPSVGFAAGAAGAGSAAIGRGAHQRLAQASVELDRARRYQRDLAVLVIRANAARSGAWAGTASLGEAPHPHGLVQQALGQIDSAVRQCDVVVRHPRLGCTVVVMPETGAEAARQAQSRLAGIVDPLHRALEIGLAVFPRDGWTLEDLVARATPAANEAASAHRPTGAPVPSV